MNVTITGASGFIGQRLLGRLLRDGHSLHAMGRSRPGGPAEVRFSSWDAGKVAVPVEAIEGTDAIVHLAGEPVGQRWNDEVKKRIRDSRVLGTRAIVEAVSKLQQRPQTLVCASAIGYYGDRADETLDEQSGIGQGFLSEVCGQWEAEARAAGNLGLRVVLTRTGIVLGREGGALKQMLPPFRLGLGGPTGSGKQWMSWIHLDDLIEAIVFSLGNVNVFGPVNATAPNPVRNEEFTKALGAALGRPTIVHTPLFALKVMLGEAAEVVLASQRVLPKVLQRAGFQFLYSDVHDALRNAV
jgi:uncharacterized protein